MAHSLSWARLNWSGEAGLTNPKKPDTSHVKNKYIMIYF